MSDLTLTATRLERAITAGGQPPGTMAGLEHALALLRPPATIQDLAELDQARDALRAHVRDLTARRRELVRAEMEAAFKMARSLSKALGRDVTAMDVEAAADQLWGCSLEQQRDGLAAGRLPRRPKPSARQLQAVRGHVTRELEAEVRAHLEAGS